MAEFELYEKLPLGGADIRETMRVLKEKGLAGAEKMLEAQLKNVKSTGLKLPEDHVVLLLGGSNGILRAVAIQLIFGEGVPVYGVHYDRKMQIGIHHVEALKKKAAEKGVDTGWWNIDATDPKAVSEAIAELKKKYKVVHLINGIAAGATKRYEKHGKIELRDLDVAFEPILQYPDFSSMDNIRKLGMVEVDIATDKDIERTNKFMGGSTTIWADQLSAEGLLKEGVSVVAFADYDFESDDPVYGMGPLAGAKILQREAMNEIYSKYNVKAVRLCYPAMDTTALGAIPAGLLMFAMTAVVLNEKGGFKNLPALAVDTMEVFQLEFEGRELRMDGLFQEILPEFHKRVDELSADDLAVFKPLTELQLP